MNDDLGEEFLTDSSFTPYSTQENIAAVKDGRVQDVFSSSQHAFTVDGDQTVLSFKVSTVVPSILENKRAKKKSKKDRLKQSVMIRKPLEFEQPRIQSSKSICTVSLRDIGKMEMLAMGEATDRATTDGFTKPLDSMYTVTPESPSYLVIDHICHSAGETEITLTMNLEREHTVMLKWNKICSWSETTLQIPAKHAAGGVFFLALFAVIFTSFICVYRNKKQIQIALEGVAGTNPRNKSSYNKMAFE